MMQKSKNRFFTAHLCFVISIILAVTFIFSGCGEKKSEEVEGTKLSVGDATCLAGDTIKLPLSLSNNSGIWGGQIIISLDSSVFDFVSCSNGVVFEMCDSNPNKDELNIIVSQLGTENTTADGVIVTVNLKVKDTVDDGEYEVKIDPETNFSNIDGELKEVTFENGTVTVK